MYRSPLSAKPLYFNFNRFENALHIAALYAYVPLQYQPSCCAV